MAVINHGTVRGYKLGCRCEECRAANTKAKRDERDRKREREGLPPIVTTARTHRPESGPIEDGPGPIENAARDALADAGGDSPLSTMRREVAYRAAAVMDNPKAAPFFKSAAEVLRITVEDLLAAAPAKDGEADAIAGLMASFRRSERGTRRNRGAAVVDDAAQSEPGDDRP